MLHLGFSNAPAMAALSNFGRAAIDSGVIHDLVTALPSVQTLVSAAAIPLANAGSGQETLDFSNAWRLDFATPPSAEPRAKSVALLTALDALPLSCLVVGAT